jgi:TonB-linked SusC/RagA family outer membrane protein
MKLLVLYLLVWVTRPSIAFDSFQQQNLTGTVTDENKGSPLPGVNIIVEGTTSGTLTDLNGKFSLPKPEKGNVVVFSFIGYETEKITYSDQANLEVKLKENITNLSEVSVVGYGTQKKTDLTGSVSTIKAKEFEKSTPATLDAVLQGRVPGLVVIGGSGDPGNFGSQITMRGIGTVNNNTPIFVVDGMIVDVSDASNPANNINFLNPADIESVDVLKDASAQAIYGSRGANGVILITTRKGTEGAPALKFSSTFSTENLIRINRVLNATEYRDYIVNANYIDYIRYDANARPDTDPYSLDASKPVVDQYNKGYNTDWMHEILRNDRVSQNYDLSLAGGTTDFHYTASAGFLDKKGLIKLSEYRRYSFRLNSDYNLRRFIHLGENLGITNSSQTGDWNFLTSVRNAYFESPLTPVLQPGTVDPTDPNYEYDKYAPTMNGVANPVLQTKLQNYHQTYLTMVGNIFAEATIIKDFKLRTGWGFNLSENENSHYSPMYYMSSNDNNAIGSLMDNSYSSKGWIWENTLTWIKKIKSHSITLLLGYTSEYSKTRHTEALKNGTPSNDPQMQTFDAATLSSTLTGGYYINTMTSYFGRINYSLMDRYLLTATIRKDGSSKFGPGHKWGTFPSFSLGWKLAEEKFFKSLAVDFINNLKLRAGWGQIGNSILPVNNAYASQTVSYKPSDDLRYIFNETVHQCYWLSSIGTPDLTWETTQQTNIGGDISIFNNALSLTADYYLKKTKNMLLQLPVTTYAGYPANAAPYKNAGTVQNEGFEILINYQVRTGKFNLGTSVNASVYRNKVTSLLSGNQPIVSLLSISRTEVGSSIGRFYGYVTNGVFQTEDEVANYKDSNQNIIQPDAHAGDFRFKDLNNDGKIDSNDETWIGSPWPKLTYGFNLNIGYKAFDLSIFFQGSYGNNIYDFGRLVDNIKQQNVFEYYFKNAWKGEGTSNTQPVISFIDKNQNYRNSDYYVEDGSYLRLKNVQLGFNLNKKVCDKLKISSARIWIGGTNLLTFTRYHLNDPEIGSTDSPANLAGLDLSGSYPRPSEYSLGLTVSF